MNLSIGQMARINHVSIQTLRLYDKMGLLKPAVVDENSGYRYYSILQCAKLDLISSMKQCGLSLKEIRNYFENGNNSWEFLNYTITNCEAQAQMITRDQKQLIEVTIKGDAQWEKNYVYYDGDKERETETEDAEHTLYYIDDGGTWKLYDLDLWTW